MKITLEVGNSEKHLVEFEFNQLTGSVEICVDQKPVMKARRLFNEPLKEIYNIEVGGKDKANVRIEKNRKQLFGHRNVVYVDNRLTRVVEGF